MYAVMLKLLRPRGQIGLGLASVLLTWPQKCAIQCRMISVVSISLLYHCNIHYKDVVNHYNVGQKFSCVVGIVAMCSYSEISTCGRPRKLGLSLGVLASTSASEFWPRPRRYGLV